MLAESRPANSARSLQRVCVSVKVGHRRLLWHRSERGDRRGGWCETGPSPKPQGVPPVGNFETQLNGLPRDENSVDPLAVHVDDFEVDRFPFGFVAD
jgi:hypothetical protein